MVPEAAVWDDRQSGSSSWPRLCAVTLNWSCLYGKMLLLSALEIAVLSISEEKTPCTGHQSGGKDSVFISMSL